MHGCSSELWLDETRAVKNSILIFSAFLRLNSSLVGEKWMKRKEKETVIGL